MTRYRMSEMLVMLVCLITCSSCSAEDKPPAKQDYSAPPIADVIADGRDIAETQCAVCHSIERDGVSPRPDAPPLRTVLANYAPEALAEDFRERIHVGHPDMPDFEFDPLGTDALLAYLLSIQMVPEPE